MWIYVIITFCPASKWSVDLCHHQILTIEWLKGGYVYVSYENGGRGEKKKKLIYRFQRVKFNTIDNLLTE